VQHATISQNATLAPDQGIGFVEIIVLLWKRRSAILLTTLAVVALASLYLGIRTTKYTVKSVIEVGALAKATGVDKSDKVPELVEATDIVVNKITTAYSDIVADQLKKAQPELENVKIEADARAMRNTSLVVVTATAPEKYIGQFVAHQNSIFTILAADHDRIFNIERTALETRREAQRLELERLKDPQSYATDLNPLTLSLKRSENSLQAIEDERFYGISVKAYENEIATAEKLLNDIKESEEQLRRTLAQKDVYEEHLRSQIKRLDAYLENGRATRAKAATGVTGSAEAMTMLMLDAELQRSAAEREKLQAELIVSLPLQRSELENQLSANQRQQAIQENAVTKAKAERQKLDLDRAQRVSEAKPDIEGLKLKVGEFQTARQRAISLQTANLHDIDVRLKNMTSTRLIVPPKAADKPSDIPAWVVLPVAGIVGIILGTMLALAMMLVAAVRSRVAGAST
jgi:Chain length determinant protein